MSRRANDEAAALYKSQREIKSDLAYIEPFLKALPAGGHVLHLGCGTGVLSSYLASRRFAVTGIDSSAADIDVARRDHPGPTYLASTLSDLHEGQFQVQGVLALYVLTHLPPEHHPRLFQVIRTFLPAGGVLLVTMGATEPEGLGANLFRSSLSPEQNRRLIEQAGFEVTLDKVATSIGERHQIILAQAT